MAMLVRLGGAWQTITGAKVFAGGAWRTLVGIQVYASGAWRTVATFSTAPTPVPLSLSISPASEQAGGSTPTIVSGAFTATPSGGVSPFTYSWVISSPDGRTSIDNPTLATTQFTATGLINGEPVIPTYQCTCTDSLGTTASAECSVTFLRST